ncbi:glycosyltransferase [Bifidobacterium sp. LC6]|uniref:Glycosyltransferase n=1 Tax=Bifidobacterium colobi TaxID=2809026 RepID=A0ABS5UXB5_9BIFI|nr:glycosyltransferase [Bifidobacterium colobi]MBT1175739.1 glycosyltransferase [Bifidobacterium colobi]
MTKASEPGHVKILYYSEGWGLGGIEQFVMNTVRHLDADRFVFDIFCTHDWSDAHDAEIRRLGGHRYTVFHNEKPGLATRFKASTRAWRRLLKAGDYDVVHINTMNGVGFVYAHIAKQEGVPVRIVHSHNSDFGEGSRGIKTIAHKLGRMLWGDSATVRLACSQIAGEYLFGNKRFEIIKNGIDTERFRFNEGVRRETRRMLHIADDELLFGAVGRLAPAKNPLFQVDILADLLAKDAHAKLLLVGDGPMAEETKQYAEKHGVADALIMPGPTNTPAPYYWALDVFTMPSTFDGFGMTCIEAMCAGLPCIRSIETPKIGIEGTIEKQLPLDDASEWAKSVLKMSHHRYQGDELVDLAGYGSKKTANRLMHLYQEAYSKSR